MTHLAGDVEHLLHTEAPQVLGALVRRLHRHITALERIPDIGDGTIEVPVSAEDCTPRSRPGRTTIRTARPADATKRSRAEQVVADMTMGPTDPPR
jgi:hypothetical protein